ncbi:MAG: hypothetical protein HY695_15510 [Deltaproteobacteria bacterium]|nr:hypothetical protein [Deltaproteobacteria bacterium]
MATLGPAGLLLIFIALSAAPLSIQQVTVHFSQYSRMGFIRNIDGWWIRSDDPGLANYYYKREGTYLLVKAGSGQDQDRTDLRAHFELTGAEDWSQPIIIVGRDTGKTIRARTRLAENGLIAEVTRDGRVDRAVISWAD